MFQWAKRNGLTVKDLTPDQREKFLLSDENLHFKKGRENKLEPLVEKVKVLFYVKKYTIFEISSTLNLSTLYIQKLIEIARHRMKSDYEKLKTESSTYIQNMHDNTSQRSKKLWSIVDDPANAETFSKIASLKELRESDRDHSKFLQSIGVLSDESSTGDNVWMKLIDDAKSLNAKKPPLDKHVPSLSDHLDTNDPA